MSEDESDSGPDIGFSLKLDATPDDPNPPPPKKSETNWVLYGIIIGLVVVGLVIGGIVLFKRTRISTPWDQIAQDYIASVQSNTPYQLPVLAPTTLSIDQQHFTKDFYAAAATLKKAYSLANMARLTTLAEHITTPPPFPINCSFTSFLFPLQIKKRLPGTLAPAINNVEAVLINCVALDRPIDKEVFTKCLGSGKVKIDESLQSQIVSVIDFAKLSETDNTKCGVLIQ